MSELSLAQRGRGCHGYPGTLLTWLTAFIRRNVEAMTETQADRHTLPDITGHWINGKTSAATEASIQVVSPATGAVVVLATAVPELTAQAAPTPIPSAAMATETLSLLTFMTCPSQLSQCGEFPPGRRLLSRRRHVRRLGRIVPDGIAIRPISGLHYSDNLRAWRCGDEWNS
jgi:hypothetical protein